MKKTRASNILTKYVNEYKFVLDLTAYLPCYKWYYNYKIMRHCIFQMNENVRHGLSHYYYFCRYVDCK